MKTFTLLEIIMTIAVVAILSALLIPRIRRRSALQRHPRSPSPIWSLVFGFWCFRRRQRFALANAGGPALGLMASDGRASMLLNSNVTLPVASRWLLYELGTDSNHVATAAGVNMPLGPSPDSPSGTIIGAALQLSVYLLGAYRGTLLGISAGAIGAGNIVYASTVTAGQIADLSVAGAGNYWIVGRAVSAVNAAGQEFAYIPCFPVLVAQSTMALSTNATGT
jgi:hypothetical protein